MSGSDYPPCWDNLFLSNVNNLLELTKWGTDTFRTRSQLCLREHATTCLINFLIYPAFPLLAYHSAPLRHWDYHIFLELAPAWTRSQPHLRECATTCLLNFLIYPAFPLLAYHSALLRCWDHCIFLEVAPACWLRNTQWVLLLSTVIEATLKDILICEF